MHRARPLRFFEAALHRSVAAHLAERQIAQADLESPADVTRDRAAQTNLEVVRMRAENEQIHGHQRLNPKTSSEGSSFSK